MSPTVFSTGILSPVIFASFMDEPPEMISPSTGMASPGLTMTMSPTTSSSTPTSDSMPFLMTFAFLGARSIIFSTASLVFPFEMASKNLPSVTRVRIIPADSKSIPIIRWWRAS